MPGVAELGDPVTAIDRLTVSIWTRPASVKTGALSKDSGPAHSASRLPLTAKAITATLESRAPAKKY